MGWRVEVGLAEYDSEHQEICGKGVTQSYPSTLSPDGICHAPVTGV